MLGLLLLAAPVVLHVQQVEDVAESEEVVAALSAAIEARVKEPVSRAMEPAQDGTVVVRLLGAPTRIRLVVSRAAIEAAGFRERTFDLPRGSRETWASTMTRVAEALFPHVKSSAQSLEVTSSGVAPASTPLGPWFLLGGGVASAVTGAALAAVHQGAARSLRDERYTAAELDDHISSYEVSGRAALVAVVVAGASISAAVIWLLSSD
ncbi:MAG: hypothetical protein IT384_29470 [Deltaproteobacteria bacterium]|nr:hypothetical protein [Deltaproteobacteria bacterium]